MTQLPKIGELGASLAEDGHEPDIEDLLRRMLQRINGGSTSGGTQRAGTNGRRVVLDICLDGTRYTLLRSPAHPKEPTINLSPREREIVRLVTKGLPNKAIAAVLDISPWTVATHLRRVFTKLAVNSRAEMVACVLKKGLLEGVQ